VQVAEGPQVAAVVEPDKQLGQTSIIPEMTMTVSVLILSIWRNY
jgi:hypothetical protein